MRAYSMDLREKIVAAYDQQKGTQEELAEVFGVSLSFVEKLLRRHRQTGSVTPKPHAGGHVPRLGEAGVQYLRQLLAQDNDLTLEELGDTLARARGVQLSTSRLCRVLKQLDLRVKKSHSTPQSETALEFKPSA